RRGGSFLFSIALMAQWSRLVWPDPTADVEEESRCGRNLRPRQPWRRFSPARHLSAMPKAQVPALPGPDRSAPRPHRPAAVSAPAAARRAGVSARAAPRVLVATAR